MWTYRRRLFIETQAPRAAVLLAALLLYSLSASPWIVPRWETGARTVAPEAAGAAVEVPLAAAEVSAPEAVEVPAPEAVPATRFLAQGQAAATVTGAARANALISISFIDGYVIEPGDRFSFDDVARTWDGKEDPRYLWSVGTGRYGLTPMRGGGVCWVSTALWRAALWAGLPTEYRQAHLGLIPSPGVGTDATNTLVIRNDTSAPITVRAWMDDEDINVALLTDAQPDRVARVRGPVRNGPGSYTLFQDITWADGTTTTRAFHSGYYW